MQEFEFRFPDYTLHRLRNGVRILLQAGAPVPVAALVVLVHAGSRHEPSGCTGIAHLLEHLMFKGSREVADGDHFRRLQEVGGSVNASTTHDRTMYYEVFPADHVDLALALEGDRFRTFGEALRRSKLENQRSVVQNERRQHYDNQPYGRSDEILGRARFPPPHPYSWPVIGSMEDLARISLQDVKQFFQDRYHGGSIFISLSGSIAQDAVLHSIEREFGSLPAAPSDAVISCPDAIPDPVHIMYEDRVTLPRLYIIRAGIPVVHEDEPVLRTLTLLIGSGRTSRLFHRLVHLTGVAQNIRAYHDPLERAGVLGIEATAAPGHGLSEIAEAIDRELRDFLARPPSDDEIQSAVLRRYSGWLQRCSSALGRASGLATAGVLAGDPLQFALEGRRIRAVTRTRILECAERYFRSPAASLSIVPLGRPDLGIAGATAIGDRS